MHARIACNDQTQRGVYSSSLIAPSVETPWSHSGRWDELLCGVLLCIVDICQVLFF